MKNINKFKLKYQQTNNILVSEMPLRLLEKLIRKKTKTCSNQDNNIDEVRYSTNRLYTDGYYCEFDYLSSCYTDTLVYDSTGKRMYFNVSYTDINTYCPSLATVSYNSTQKMLFYTSKRYLCGA